MIMEYSSLRKNGFIGIIQDHDMHLHATEWWSGEGLDFTFENLTKGKDRQISLHIDELENLVSLAYVMGFIDFDAVKEKADEIKTQFEKDQKLFSRDN